MLPVLEYGDIFLLSTTVENRKWLQILQNKGLCCPLNLGIETSSDDLHKEANLLKLKYRGEQHLLNYMFDYAKNIQNCKGRTTGTIKTRSMNKVLLKIKRPYTEKFRKSLSYRGQKMERPS